jgi:hypothetical protein
MVNTSYKFITVNNIQASSTTNVNTVAWLPGKNITDDPSKTQAGLLGLVCFTKRKIL